VGRRVDVGMAGVLERGAQGVLDLAAFELVVAYDGGEDGKARRRDAENSEKNELSCTYMGDMGIYGMGRHLKPPACGFAASLTKATCVIRSALARATRRSRKRQT
jgi:hypothetical protein